MPRHHERRSRRPRHARLAMMAVAGACAFALAFPAAAPTGDVLELMSGPVGAGTAVGQEPTPAGAPTPPATSVKDGRHPFLMAPGEPAVTPAPAPSTTPVPWPTAPPLAALTGYRWPIAHPRLTLPFGPTVWGSRLVNGKRFHDGVDLATFCGDRIRAAHGGKVLAAGRHYDRFMGWIGDLGPYLRRLERKHLWITLPIVVVIDDGNGYRSVYAHFGRIVVTKGDRVEAGDLLGYEGATGRASGCHLHYSLFSPMETATFRIRPDVVDRMKLPKAEIARVDPLLVLPPKPGINAPAKPKTSPVPDAGPGASPAPAPKP